MTTMLHVLLITAMSIAAQGDPISRVHSHGCSCCQAGVHSTGLKSLTALIATVGVQPLRLSLTIQEGKIYAPEPPLQTVALY